MRQRYGITRRKSQSLVDIRAIRYVSFLQALWRLYRRTGGKLLSREKIEERLSKCRQCDEFSGRGCNKCGCCTNELVTLFNKVAHPTQRCPKDPPEWVEEEL